MAIFYLDIDDEITSAAARIRGTEDLSVVLVLPAGSRIATSRINFRLLAREAQQRSRRLSIVAPDAAARALAATAGLPVYASTMEYESALSTEATQPAAMTGEPSPVGRGAAGLPASVPESAQAISQARRLTPDELAARDAALAGGVPLVADTGAPKAGLDGTHEPYRGRRPSPTTGLGPEPDAGPRTPRRRGRRAALVIGLLLLAFVGVAGGAAAYLLLPDATIVLAIRATPLPPLVSIVTADPAATAADPSAGVVPAIRVDLPLTASGTFKATGKRVDEAPATGSVRWTNCDPTRAYTIRRGRPCGPVPVSRSGRTRRSSCQWRS